jgi:DNA-binding transcriptional MerR regulator
VAVPEDLEWLDDAARRVQKHPATLRRWVQAGLLKTHKKVLDRRVYVDREQLDRLIADPPLER